MEFNDRNLREGQAIILMGLIDRLVKGHRMSSALLHPRGGKSAVQRLVSLWAVSVGMWCCGISINPNLLLRDQMGDEDRRRAGAMLRMEETLSWFDVTDLNFDVNVNSYKYWPDNPLANGETFISFNIQTLTSKAGRDGLLAWTESMVAAGKPPGFFFDECQMLGPKQPWGFLFWDLLDLGAYCITTTGTALRSDGTIIPGFHQETIEVSDVERTAIEADPDPDFVQVVKLEGKLFKLRQRADVEAGLPYGWNPPKGQPPALCKLTHKTFDFPVEITENDRVVYTGMVSNAPRNRATEAIGKGVWQDAVIDEACDMLVKELSLFRKSDPTIKAIVYTCNDGGGREINAHARKVCRAIQRRRPEWGCLVATSADDDDLAPELARKIADFDKSDAVVLIVKQAGGVGLDAPTIKVGADVSNVRQPGPCLQRMLRTATPYNDHYHAVWITPADPLWRRIWHENVKENGGVMTRADLEEIERTRRPRNENPRDVSFEFGDVIPGYVQDNLGDHLVAAELQSAYNLVDLFPGILRDNTYPQIAKKIAASGVVIQPPSPSPSPSPSVREVAVRHFAGDVEAIKKLLNDRIRSAAFRQLHDEGFSHEQIHEIVQPPNVRRVGRRASDLWFSGKQDAGWPDPYLSLTKEMSLERLEALERATRPLEQHHKPDAA